MNESLAPAKFCLRCYRIVDKDDAKRGIKNLLIAGVTTDVSCFATATGANDSGYNAIMLEDCVASFDPERHKAAFDIVTAQGGIFGWVTTSEKVMAALSTGVAG